MCSVIGQVVQGTVHVLDEIILRDSVFLYEVARVDPMIAQ
jgi:hypothetical protein